MKMLCIRYLYLLVASACVTTAILEGLGQTDLSIVRIRLEEEKAKRLLLQNDVEVLMLQVEELKRKSDERDMQAVHGNVSLGNHVIAFTATLTLSTTYVSGQTVVFDQIWVNEGNCYDNSTGRFKAPAKGLYSFSLSSLIASTGVARLLIMKDNEEIGKVYAPVTASVTVIAVMDKDQVVYVKDYTAGSSDTIHGYHWSMFTGLLLHRYE